MFSTKISLLTPHVCALSRLVTFKTMQAVGLKGCLCIVSCIVSYEPMTVVCMFFITGVWQNLSDTCASFLCIMPCYVVPVVSSVKLWCFWNLRHRTLTSPGQVVSTYIHLSTSVYKLCGQLGSRGGAVVRTLASPQCGTWVQILDLTS